MKRALAPLILCLLASPALAIEPGWHVSPLPGEGDRASLGCARDSSDTDFACLAVRCEDDYSVGVHVYTTRLGGDTGRWTMTLDREDKVFKTSTDASPYGARLADPEGVLLDRIRHGTFIYLQHADDTHAPFRYIDLGGSFQSVAEALYWCAPRVPPSEQNTAPDVDPDNEMEKRHEPSPAGTQ
ncbi:hypothetical protein [Devosia rhizoryzae]|uniref:DUF992 domain-containing protein n=1 Tax=Devosia rhizoryzae TaxID=2774137 RepID=A0ABX7C3E7_9HYPH|nr:hypothetical protein [Devosia rhizoryzae]QQR38763.1 hypothetical protein JI748_13520 [Devosia rhizoryzae]